jgi:hypothetical protein
MPERLVDVKESERVVHTFPVTISDRDVGTGEDGFKKKALQAAANAKLVPNKECETLSATMHISRSGPLEPDRDPFGVMAETKAGQPNGRADEFLHRAQHQRWCERAYALWEREGCPQGKADEHWHRTLNFETD